MKLLKQYLFRILFISVPFFCVSPLSAQYVSTVVTNLVIPPPYSPFFKDYVYNSKAIVTLLSYSVRKVYITATITKDDNSIQIDVKDQYRPGIPLNLVPYQLLTLTGPQLKNIYGNGSTNDLVLQGITEKEITYNQALPEGNYNICVHVKDYDTRQEIGQACRSIYIAYYEPPQIINPINTGFVLANEPQFVMTNWTPAAPGAAGTNYRLKIAKLINGINPLDALNNNVQVVIDKGSIPITNFPLDLGSGIKLEPGANYVMQVTATAPNAYFKNGGKSEFITFAYKKPALSLQPPAEESFQFFTPQSLKNKAIITKTDTVTVSNNQRFFLAWNWLPATNNSNTPVTVSEIAYKKYGVAKYTIRLLPATGSTATNFSYTTDITAANADVLKSNLSLSKTEADAIGLQNKYHYRAIVTAYDGNNSIVTQDTSNNFVYLQTAGAAEKDTVSIAAVMKYAFKGFPEQYAIPNTPVQVEVMRKPNPSVPIESLQALYTGGFFVMANATVFTDAAGKLNVKIPVYHNYLTTDSVFFRVKINSNYYLSDTFSIRRAKTFTKDTAVNLGQMVAKTYGYSLRVLVNKHYPSYKMDDKGDISMVKDAKFYKNDQFITGSDGVTYRTEISKPDTGITMVLYRKKKEPHLPPVEGNLTPESAGTNGNEVVEVGRGKTKIEKIDGKEQAYVKFEKLLANLNEGDEYYMIAINKTAGSAPVSKTTSSQQAAGSPSTNTGSPIFLDAAYSQSGGGTTPIAANYKQQAPVDVINHISSNLFQDNAYQELGFEAIEASVIVPKPKNVNHADSFYRNIIRGYEIVSKDPPTSMVKGRLLYQWKNSSVKRPLANQKFKIIIGYMVNGEPFDNTPEWKNTNRNGSVGYTKTDKVFLPDGVTNITDGLEMLDYDKTMAIGTTDAQGNFEVKVNNLNWKGSLGQGRVVDKSMTVSLPKQVAIDRTVIPNLLSLISYPGIYGYNPANYFSYLTNSSLISSLITTQQDGLNPLLAYTNFNYSAANLTHAQSAINTGLQVRANVTGRYTVAPKLTNFSTAAGKVKINTRQKSGPNNEPWYEQEAPEDGEEDESPLVELKRVYRIVPLDNPHLFRAKETFIVNAFEEVSLPAPHTCMVKEVKVKVIAKVNGMATAGILVTLFRNLDSKNTNGKYDLPLGEGDNNYVQKALISPTYQGTNPDNTKVEYLHKESLTDDVGTITFDHLLPRFKYYYVQATSDPEQGTKLYKATIEEVSNSTIADDPAHWAGTAPDDIAEITVNVTPLPSRAMFRVKDAISETPISKASIHCYKGPVGYGLKTTDEAGYLEWSGDPKLNYSDRLPIFDDNTVLSFYAHADGYTSSGYEYKTFNKNGTQHVVKFQLQPAGKISSRIVSADESMPGKPKGVPSYLRLPNGKVYITADDGSFADLLVPAINGYKIEVFPKDIAYFNDETFTYTNPPSKKQDFGNVKVYRRKHRVSVVVLGEDGTGIPNAIAQVGDETDITIASGHALFQYENVSVNNFTLTVKGPAGSNYIPVIKNFTNNESKKVEQVITITLKEGSEISGIVTLDNTPVANAKVYLDAAIMQSDKAPDAKTLLVAHTDKSGKYIIRGVPLNSNSIDVLATLDTSFTVSGDRKPATIQNKKGTANLGLTSYKDLLVKSIFGFPLSVEKIEPVAGSTDKLVTGTVGWTLSKSSFKPENANQVMRIEKVRFSFTQTGNLKTGVPVSDEVPLDGLASLKLRYENGGNKYNVQIAATPVATNTSLTLKKEGGYGVLKGYANIVDNSFDYPSTYLNFGNTKGFYLAEKTAGGQLTNQVTAVRSVIAASQSSQWGNSDFNQTLMDALFMTSQNYLPYSPESPAFYLTDKDGGDLSFKFLEFEANAAGAGSYLSNKGKIHLDIAMTCSIPHATPEKFTVRAGNVVLDNNTIDPSSGSSPIEIKLEDWKLVIKNWRLGAVGESGLLSSNGLIQTQGLDVPFDTFVLRKDLCLITGFKLKELTIGGGIEKVSVAATPQLVYDHHTGRDNGAHWRLSISGNGAEPVATLPYLKGLTHPDGKPLGFNYVQLLSNGEQVFQLQQTGKPYKIKNNNKAEFTPQGILNGTDFFTVSGTMNTNTPRMGDIMLDLMFKGTNGEVDVYPQNVSTDFEGKGFVHFTAADAGAASNITINENEITIQGSVEEKPAKSFKEMAATLRISNTETKVVLQAAKVDLTTSYQLAITAGGMRVENNDWTLLVYKGIMTSKKQGNGLQAKGTEMEFTVLGDVSATSDQLKVDSFETGFGQMKVVYDFKEKRLIGTLTVNNVPIGLSTITGTVETVFDDEGFYIAGGGVANIQGVHPFVNGVYNVGFMVGNYSLTSTQGKKLWQTVNAYKQPEMVSDCFVSKTGGSFKGLYLSVDRVIIDVDKTFDYILISGYLKAKALIGVDIWASFGTNPTAGIGVKINAGAEACLASGVTGTYIEGSQKGYGAVTLSEAGLNLNVGISFTAKVKQFLILDTFEASKRVNCTIACGTNGFSFNLDTNSSSDKPVCYKQ